MVAATTPLRAAIYTRVSTGKQEDEGTSLITQLDECRRYAHAKGYAVVSEYQEVYTGTALYERPRLSVLREAIRAKTIDGVIAYAIDRLSRDATHLGVILSEADHKGVTVEFVSEPLDDSPEGQLIRFIKGYAAKIEHAKIKDRSKRGREHRAKSGKPIPGGSPPLGYQWSREWIQTGTTEEIGHFTVSGYDLDPDTKEVARRIFFDVIAGVSLTKLSAALNAEGVPTSKYGRQWYHTTLRAILKNPIYKGEPESLKSIHELVKGKRSPVRQRPENERVKGTAPAIVSPEEWQAANDQLARNRREAVRESAEPELYLLRAGFIRCGYCGGPVTAGRIKNRRTNIPSYRCSPQNKYIHGCPGGGAIAAHKLDAAVWEKVETIRAHPERLLAEIEADLTGEDTSAADLEAVNRELDRITRSQTITANAVAKLDNAEAAEPLLAKLEILAKQKLQLKAERESIESRRSELVAGQELLQRMYQELERRTEEPDELTYQEKRHALRRFGFSVKLWKQDHDPRYQIASAIDTAALVEQFHRELAEEPTDPEIWLDYVPADTDLGAFAGSVEADRADRRTGRGGRPRRRPGDRAGRRGRLPAAPISPPAQH